MSIMFDWSSHSRKLLLCRLELVRSNVFQICWTCGGQMVHESRYAVNRGCGESTRQLLSLEWECISLQLANENSSSKETVSHR